MGNDFADLHVARWRDHWIDIPFDDQIEAATVRLSRIARFFRDSSQTASAEVGLQQFEYETLHQLMIRDTPGHASPRALAEDLGVSPPGMTGRLDTLEKAGYIKRTPSPTDRRSVNIEATTAGVAVWRRAMLLRGHAEMELLGALSERELATLNRLLKKLTTAIEASD
ncbi:MarR family transcriptional regulator [Dactylosporangium sp. NBC_01737]|jgi:DNA-binding MarR family transcriptional regulator|uniref:MarR family winged helix-turn-helix transcriptional regulator n=1 Tax=Dactylosporangium sp. NBC_01737 TaxID=2975959 RepID=UPI002E0DD1B4|nr:MarR family transcriptional regulator [Dactylosporangium sp. NBC_01737]